MTKIIFALLGVSVLAVLVTASVAVYNMQQMKERSLKSHAVLKESALKHLKNGENTLAVTARHNWRWGMLFMHVYNDGFGFRLDGQVKE